MARVRSAPRFHATPLLLAVGSILLGGLEAFADRIVLRGGGEVRGKVIDDPGRPDRVSVVLATGKTPLSFQKPQILRVIPEASALDEYVARLAKLGPGAEARYELGLWCESQKLADLAARHLRTRSSRTRTSSRRAGSSATPGSATAG